MIFSPVRHNNYYIYHSTVARKDIPAGAILLPLYADDVILYSNIHSIEDCRSLQDDLNSLNMEWSHKWQMHFNPRKCEFLRITNKKTFLSFSYHINGCQIQEVPHARYLGVTLDQHLSWNEHIKQIANKATI